MTFPVFDLRRAAAVADQFEFYGWIFQQLYEMAGDRVVEEQTEMEESGPTHIREPLGTDV